VQQKSISDPFTTNNGKTFYFSCFAIPISLLASIGNLSFPSQLLSYSPFHKFVPFLFSILARLVPSSLYIPPDPYPLKAVSWNGWPTHREHWRKPFQSNKIFYSFSKTRILFGLYTRVRCWLPSSLWEPGSGLRLGVAKISRWPPSCPVWQVLEGAQMGSIFWNDLPFCFWGTKTDERIPPFNPRVSRFFDGRCRRAFGSSDEWLANAFASKRFLSLGRKHTWAVIFMSRNPIKAAGVQGEGWSHNYLNGRHVPRLHVLVRWKALPNICT